MKDIVRDIIYMVVIVKHFAGYDVLQQMLEYLQKLSRDKYRHLQEVHINHDTPYYKVIADPECYPIWALLPINIKEMHRKLIVATIINVLSNNSCNSYELDCISIIINCFARYLQVVNDLLEIFPVKLNLKISNTRKFSVYGYRQIVKIIDESTISTLNEMVESYIVKKLKKSVPKKPFPYLKERSDKEAEKYADKIMKELYETDPYYKQLRNYSGDT